MPRRLRYRPHSMVKSVSFTVSSRFEWTVENIFCADGELSEIFGFDASLWRLILWKVHVFEDTYVIRVFLRAELAEKPFRDFTSRVFIVDKNQTPHFLTERVCKRKGGCYDECVWQTDIKGLREREGVLSVDGAVSFVCVLMLKSTSEEKDKEKSFFETSTKAKAEDGIDTLVLDFARMLGDVALSDVTLKCGACTIPAHRLILSARSEVFAAMLRSDLAESRSGVIEISDMDPPVLDQLLQFIYSCQLPDLSMDAAPQLYEAADKYGLESLKKICSAFMAENLTKGNACRILIFSDAHSDCDLKDCVVAFIVKTKLYHEDDIWLKFCEHHPKLAIEVLNRACKTYSCFV